jgi:hypothetical protein
VTGADAVLRGLGPAGESVARRWLDVLAVDLDEAPALRLIVEMIAVETLAAEVRRTARVRWADCYRRAGAMLGLPQSRVDGIRHTLRAWRRRSRAVRDSGALQAARDYLAEHPNAQPRELVLMFKITMIDAVILSEGARTAA